MDKFCDSILWDTNLTWYTTDPYFSPCFEKTVLTFCPLTFALLFGFIDILNISKSHFKRKSFLSSFVPLMIMKCGLTSTLIILQLTQIVIFKVNLDNMPTEYFTIDFLAASLLILGYIIALILSIFTNYYKVKSSGVQFFYWLLTVLTQAILFRTSWENYHSDHDYKGIIYLMRLISFPLIVFRFILEWFDENMCKKRTYGVKLEKPSPEKTSIFISKLLILWFDKLAWLGYKQTLTKDHLWDLNYDDTSSFQYKKFLKYYTKTKVNTLKENLNDTNEPSVSVGGIFIPLCKTYGLSYAFGVCLQIISDMIAFVQPLMLSYLVTHVRNPELEPAWKGFFYVATICAVSLVQSVLNASGRKRAYLTGMRIRTILSGALFRKALVISAASKKESSVGEIVNLMSVDSQRMLELLPLLNMSIGGVFQILFAIYFLYSILGYSVFAGVIILILVVPLNAFLVSVARKYQVQQMKLKDERIKLISEVIAGMKVLKLYAWEAAFTAQIEEIRQREIDCLRKIGHIDATCSFIFRSSPLIVSLASFATFVLSDSNNVFNAEVAFVSITLFNMLRLPMILLPMIVSSGMQASVSIARLNKYLNMEELDQSAVTHDESYEDPIVIEDGSFSWTSESITLKNINFRVKQGELIAIVGTIGSGKSSLLSTLLGDLRKHGGAINITGDIAYVSQSAWIQNTTVKGNIIFGDKLNLTRYKEVIASCALKSDLQVFTDGDETEIGEKGINLSGGQKQRIALARASYKDTSIYLFDDPLSAVDSHVGKHIFENLIGPTGMLKQKTRVLVTHGVSFLPHVDRIVVMKNGQISEIGTYKDLLYKKGEFAELLLQHIGIETKKNMDTYNQSVIQDLHDVIGAELVQQRSFLNRESITKAKKSAASSNFEKPVLKKLVKEEVSAKGRIKLSVFKDFLKPTGVPLTILTILFSASGNVLIAFSNIWISNWSTQVSVDENETEVSKEETTVKYIIGYSLIIVAHGVSTIVGGFALVALCLAATKSLHKDALRHVMKAPMSYFDSTLIGRILNRFSKDVDTLDNFVPLTLRASLFLSFNVLSIISVISYTIPQFIAFIIPVAIFYLFLQRFYVSTNTQLKRLEAVSRSPIYSHFSETVAATSIIRAFKLEDGFITESENRVDMNQKTYLPFVYSLLWIAIRLEIIGMFIILAVCIFVLHSRGSMDNGSAGLAIAYALQFTAYLNLLTRQASDFEANIVSVERVTELKQTPQELEWENFATKPPPGWPEHGELKFDNYATRYREGFDLVLKGISFTIKSGEKIGVVGRTGAGKSSLTMALFRIIESAGGTIYIDGVDISTLGIHDLRKKLTIIPQDPVLFSGTLRLNLDPFNQHSDEQVWKCLELAHLKPHVTTLNGGFQYKVEEEGQNFSVGQRQLICLARALLRKTRILVLDEATAAVDLETDDLIQATIRKEFADSTVITIAHRLNTIMDSNRVLVLDNGEVREFDTPDSLLENENSIFWRMARDAKII